MIERLYFTTSSPNPLHLRGSLDFKEYPYQRYSLPSELEVRAAILGDSSEFRNSGGIASTDEAVHWFKMERRKKKGVEEKVRDILSRKTIVIDGKLCWQASL
jgi:3-hydroxyisobutyryl-CoA hydrolase